MKENYNTQYLKPAAGISALEVSRTNSQRRQLSSLEITGKTNQMKRGESAFQAETASEAGRRKARQLACNCLSTPGPPFFALLCDTGAGPSRQFSFANWQNVSFVRRRQQRGPARQ